jgi:hypothetical protein
MRPRPDFDERDDIARLNSWVRWGIWAAGLAGLGALAKAFFVFDDFIKLVAQTAPEAVAKISVLFYYVCWQVGAPMDLTLHTKVLVKDSQRGELGWQLAGGFVLFFLVALGLMLASPHDYLLALALLVFWAVLTVMGELVRVRTTAMFWDSLKWYREREMFFDVEKVAVVIQYFYGPQMKLRNKVGFALIGITCIATIPPVRTSAAYAIHNVLPLLSQDAASALIPSVCFAFVVIITEGWQYAMRLHTFAAVAELDRLKRNYQIEPFAVASER